VISTGDISRELEEANEKIREIIKSGELVPDNVIFNELKRKIEQIPPGKGFILDGFPRTLAQAKKLDEFIFKLGIDISKIIYLNVPEEELIKRLSKRVVCSKCGSVSFDKKKCSICGGEMIKREDDKLEVILKRIDTYMEKTIPVVDYFRNKGDLVEINGDQPIENVTKDILKAIK